MLHRALLLTGAAALAAILGLVAVVLDASPSEPGGVEQAAVAIQSVAPDGNEAPDPTARGVVILSQQGQLYSYTPDGEAVSGPFFPSAFDGTSPNGAWQAMQVCTDGRCELAIMPANSGPPADATEAYTYRLDGVFVSGEWSRSGASFAAVDDTGSLYLIEPFSGEVSVVQACCVTAYTWTSQDELLIAGEGKWRESWLALTAEGQQITRISTHGAPITRFYESPDATQFAFAQSTGDGLGLSVFDTATGLVTDFGMIHEGQADEGVPFAIAWSPDQRYIAVGPVAAPYNLLVLDARHGTVVARHSFEEGYAGELVWSPVENKLAISTYSPDRLRHEVYVVDVADGEAPRHLLGGCRIVWSPDGQFLAAKAEPHSLGAAAVNVDTGHYWQLAAISGLTPVAWGEDEASARLLINTPGRSAAVLGK